jgi:hypothetical protein
MNGPLLRLAGSRVTRTRIVCVSALGVLVFPAAGHAHSTSSVIAADDVARLSRASVAEGVTARVIDGNRKLELTVVAPRTVTVIGYGGEPFLRFDRAGVFVNERSLTAVTNKLTRQDAAPALDKGAPPRWQLIAQRHRFAWHDHRLAPAPGPQAASGRVGNWSIPLDVDGRALRVEGGLWHARGPPLWPWLLLLAVAVGAGAALAILAGRSLQRGAAITCVAVAGAAFLVAASGFALAPSTGSAWASLALPVVVAVVALAFFVFRPHLRYGAAGVVGILVTTEAASELSIFGHGYVISVLPASVERAAVAIALMGGLIASIVALTGLLRDGGRASQRTQRPTKRPAKPPPRLAIPRGRQR